MGKEAVYMEDARFNAGTLDVETVVKGYLVDKGGVDPEVLKDSSRRMSELGLDSLSTIELLFEIEDGLGCEIKDASIVREMTLADLYALIRQLIEEKKNDATELQPVSEPAIGDAIPAKL
jgi:acyl carrier protein